MIVKNWTLVKLTVTLELLFRLPTLKAIPQENGNSLGCFFVLVDFFFIHFF